MLGLQLLSPADGVFEVRVFALQQQLHRLGVAQANKVVLEHDVQPLQETGIDELVEKLHLRGAAIQHGLDDVLDHRFRDVHIPREIAKRHLRLNHPKLRRVARREAVFRAEGRPERVDIPERHRKRFAVELAGNGQVRRLAEEVAGEIDVAVLVLRHILERKRRDLKHLTRAFAVRARDQRCMHIDKPVLLEELVNRGCDHRTHAKRRLKGVRARTQMLNRAQVLQRVPLLLQRIVRGAGALEYDLVCVDFKRLRSIRRHDQLAGNRDGTARGKPVAQISIVALKNDLNGCKAGSIGEFDKAEGFSLASSAYPAAHFDCADIRLRRLLNLGQFERHKKLPL